MISMLTAEPRDMKKLDPKAFDFFDMCQKHMVKTYMETLGAYTKNMKQIQKLDASEKNGSVLKFFNLQVPTLNFGTNDVMAEFAKDCSKELSESFHKFSLEFQRKVIASCKRAGDKLKQNLVNIPAEFIIFGKTSWIGLNNKFQSTIFLIFSTKYTTKKKNLLDEMAQMLIMAILDSCFLWLLSSNWQ